MDEIEKICLSLNQADKIVLSKYSGRKNKFSELFSSLDGNAVSKAIRELVGLNLVKAVDEASVEYVPSDLGEKYLERGLPEVVLAKYVSSAGIVSYRDAVSGCGLDEQEMKAAVGELRRLGVLDVTSRGLSVKGDLDQVIFRQKALEMVNSGDSGRVDQSILTALSRRGIIEKRISINKDVKLTDLGEKVLDSSFFLKEGVGRLSQDVISGWRYEKEHPVFMRYDLNAQVPVPVYGNKNVVKDFIKLIKDVLYDMGFSEMDGPYVESAFWNFDVMLFRQNHPDRDIQDTFYVYGGEAKLPVKLLRSVKSTYERGFDRGKFDRSFGYRMEFDENESRKLMLRAHDTAMTFRYMYNIISKQKDKPARYFALAKVFRNETLDITHLAEFNQVEGVVYDDNLTVKSLVGYLFDFYERIGIKEIRVKPTYNPYTEPSFEVQGYSDSLDRWIEIGNSGIFRPEVTNSFGVTKNVLGWGLALERALMLRLGINDVRTIYGAFADIDFLRGVEQRKLFEGMV